MTATVTRLTQYAHGGGCACKIPPGELESVLTGLIGVEVTDPAGELVVGLDDGDDAAVVQIRDGLAMIATATFLPQWLTTPTTRAASPPPTPCRMCMRWVGGQWWR